MYEENIGFGLEGIWTTNLDYVTFTGFVLEIFWTAIYNYTY